MMINPNTYYIEILILTYYWHKNVDEANDCYFNTWLFFSILKNIFTLRAKQLSERLNEINPTENMQNHIQ